MIVDPVTKEQIPEPICPINMYFEGDEGIRCDTSKCDWNMELRRCTEACKIEQENKITTEELSKILLEKLTKEEIRALCIAWDDGSLDAIFDVLMEQDMKNYPEDYELTTEEKRLEENIRRVDTSEDE